MNLTCLLVPSAFAFGMIGPNASHGALTSMPEIAGIAGAMLTSLQMTVAVIASAIVAGAFAGLGIFAMLLPMLGFATLAAAAYVFMAQTRPASGYSIPTQPIDK